MSVLQQVHWPSFWLGLLAPWMLTLAVLIVAGIICDLVDAGRRDEL